MKRRLATENTKCALWKISSRGLLLVIFALLLQGSVAHGAMSASINYLHPASGDTPSLQSDMKIAHQEILSEALTVVPEQCRDTLQSLFVRYDNPERRGMAGASTMILDGAHPDNEFRALFFHEFGHVADLGCLQGTPDSPISAFKDYDVQFFENDPSVRFYEISWEDEFTQKKDARSEDFVSGYAKEDAFEDLAETFVYYLLQQERFKERARENEALRRKYSWMRRHLFQGSIPEIAEGLSTENDGIPWDSTKLPYVWKSDIVTENGR